MDDLIRLLNQDIEGEHRAIVQYLYHAWQVPEEALRGKLEGLARDEMRHLEWLSEQVVEMGAKPDLRRGQVVREGTLRDLLNAVLKDEQAAIVAYGERIQTAQVAGNAELALLLERIRADEEGHRDFLESALADLPQVPSGPTPAPAVADDGSLQWGIRHEYEVIMDYVLHAMAGGDAEARHELLDLAVDEMKHLGWLAERLTENGGRPELEEVSPPTPSPLVAMLQRALDTESMVAQKYDEGAKRTPDEETKRLFLRVRLDELYHDHVFRKMLKRLGHGKLGRQFTVGSLKKGV